MQNDVISREAFRASDLAVNDYGYNTVPGTFDAVLQIKAQGTKGILRVFFLFDDGRKVIAPVYHWQKYLGFYEIPLGSKVRLAYTETVRGTYLTGAEVLVTGV